MLEDCQKVIPHEHRFDAASWKTVTTMVCRKVYWINQWSVLIGSSQAS